jgi:hypothetical protein
MPLSNEEIQERAATATALLNDPLLNEAILQIRDGFVNQLVASGIGSEAAISAHAGLKVLEAFKGELQAVIVNMKMNRTRTNG